MSGEQRAESVKNLNILVDILSNIRLRGRIILIFLKIVQKPTYYRGIDRQQWSIFGTQNMSYSVGTYRFRCKLLYNHANKNVTRSLI